MVNRNPNVILGCFEHVYAMESILMLSHHRTRGGELIVQGRFDPKPRRQPSHITIVRPFTVRPPGSGNDGRCYLDRDQIHRRADTADQQCHG